MLNKLNTMPKTTKPKAREQQPLSVFEEARKEMMKNNPPFMPKNIKKFLKKEKVSE